MLLQEIEFLISRDHYLAIGMPVELVILLAVLMMILILPEWWITIPAAETSL